MSSSFLQKCKPKITRISALLPNKHKFNLIGDFLVRVGSFFGYDPCLLGRAEILVILGCILGETMTSYIHSEFN